MGVWCGYLGLCYGGYAGRPHSSLNFLLCEPHILVPTSQLGLHHATLGQETLWIPSLVEPGCEQLLLADLEDPFFTGEGLSTGAHPGTARLPPP